MAGGCCGGGCGAETVSLMLGEGRHPRHPSGAGQRRRASLHWWDCGAHGHTRTAQGPTDADFCSCWCCWGGTDLLVRVVGGGGVVVVVDAAKAVRSIETCLVVGCADFCCDWFWLLAVTSGGHIERHRSLRIYQHSNIEAQFFILSI